MLFYGYRPKLNLSKLELRLLFFFLGVSYSLLGQTQAIWQYSSAFCASDLIHMELTVNYEFLKVEDNIFGLSGGFKWYTPSKLNEGIVTNYFTATTQVHPNYHNTRPSQIHRKIQKDVHYFDGTTSYSRLGYFVPSFSIPVSFFFVRQLTPKKQSWQLSLKMEMLLFFHKGYALSIKGKRIKNFGFSPEYQSQIAMYQEVVRITPTVETNFDYAIGLQGRIRLFKRYFIDITPKLQIMTKPLFSVVKYHGLQTLTPKISVSLGKFRTSQTAISHE